MTITAVIALTSACSAAGGGDAAVRTDPGISTARPAAPAAVPAVITTPTTTPRPATTPRPPAPDACAGNPAAQRVIVDVSAQHAWLCARGHTVYQSAVTTGAVDLPYDATPLGTFQVQARNRDTTLTLADGRAYNVRYWVPFDAPLYGFHDASWQSFPFGSTKYRTQGSHGCVHLPMAAMAYLYHWVSIGTAVTVRA